MNKGLLAISALSVVLFACDRHDARTSDRMNSSSYEDTDRTSNLNNTNTYRYDTDTTTRANGYSTDTTPSNRFTNFSTYSDTTNTRNNYRDRDFNTLTSGDQSEAPEDLVITKQIRRIILDKGQLSTNAKNVKIITVDGYVTLRGVVNNDQESNFIERAAKNIRGVKDVDNQLDVSSTSNSFRQY